MQLSPVSNCRNIAWRLPGRLQSAMTSASIRKGHTPDSQRMVFHLILEQRGSMQNGHIFAPRNVSLFDRYRVISSSSSWPQALPVKRNENRAREFRDTPSWSTYYDNAHQRCRTTRHHRRRHYSRVIINFSDYASRVAFGAKYVNYFLQLKCSGLHTLHYAAARVVRAYDTYTESFIESAERATQLLGVSGLLVSRLLIRYVGTPSSWKRSCGAQAYVGRWCNQRVEGENERMTMGKTWEKGRRKNGRE